MRRGKKISKSIYIIFYMHIYIVASINVIPWIQLHLQTIMSTLILPRPRNNLDICLPLKIKVVFLKRKHQLHMLHISLDLNPH